MPELYNVQTVSGCITVKSNIERLECRATSRTGEKDSKEELNLTIKTLRKSVDNLTDENQKLKVTAIAMNTSANTNSLKGTNKVLETQNSTLQVDIQHLAKSERLAQKISDNATASILNGVEARATLLKKCDSEAQLLEAQTNIERLQEECSKMLSKHQTEVQDKQEGSSSLLDLKDAELKIPRNSPGPGPALAAGQPLPVRTSDTLIGLALE
ncbi:hypothetical protein DFJ43DRAFT_1038183 [Lentinula guzmanii]|uniref:Uncharacterized protein n=1 Tax=Lentinula guzmanii TaxID=2804957 RepID=A0AA38JBN1_9AGAR|nr:hypothetical protein DFJ43DRAFT_1038183 [Lentinula guzmanii]